MKEDSNMAEQTAEQSEKARSDKEQLNNWVAVAVALIATFTGVTKIKDDNIVQAMLQTKSDAVDRWNESQAAKIKMHIEENGLKQIELAIASSGLRPQLAEAQDEFKKSIAKYKSRAEESQAAAKQNEQAYDDLGYRDDQFDMSDMFLSIAMSLLAVAALTGKRWLFYFAMVLSVFGVFMGTAAFLEWHIHPNFLVKFLT